MNTTLVIFTKSGRRKEIPLRPGVTIIGRRPDCDIRIPTAFVSRKHARILCQDSKTVVQDLGSSNGNFVNSERITETAVNPGDTLSVGSAMFTVQIDGEPGKITPPKKGSSRLQDSGVVHGSGQSATLTAAQDDFVPPIMPENEIDLLADMEPLADDNISDDNTS